MKRKKEKTSLPVHCKPFLLHRYLPSPSTLLVGCATGTAHRLFHCFRLLSLSNGNSQREESFHVEKQKIFRTRVCACSRLSRALVFNLIWPWICKSIFFQRSLPAFSSVFILPSRVLPVSPSLGMKIQSIFAFL